MSNPYCPQCKLPIEGHIPKAYAVGWCEQDIHFGPCLTLHIRACTLCRRHNEAIIARNPTAS